MKTEELFEEFSKKDPYKTILGEVNAFFRPPVAPEYLTSEALTASFYRITGFTELKDSQVHSNSRALTSLHKDGVEFNSDPFTSQEVWKILTEVLLSPEEPKQSRSTKYADLLFLAPLTPKTVYFSHPVRLSKKSSGGKDNAFNAELLLQALIKSCSWNNKDCAELWDEIHEALSVHNDERDDYFSRIVEHLLQNCINKVKEHNPSTEDNFPLWIKKDNVTISSKDYYAISSEDRMTLSEISPLNEIRNGIKVILSIKQNFTRWQWLTMLNAQMRISVIAFMLWLIELHSVVGSMISSITSGIPLPEGGSAEVFKKFYKNNHNPAVFCYGDGVAKTQKKVVTDYARERYKIAFFLKFISLNMPERFNSFDWSSIDGIVSSLRTVQDFFTSKEVQAYYEKALVEVLNLNSCQKAQTNILKKYLELFAVLKQKVVAEHHQDFIRYDQSYLISKKAAYASAPFVVKMGSVLCFTIVYCCAHGRYVFPLKDLYSYLKKYYITIQSAHIGEFLDYLKGLGLTMDSPDAGDGLIIRNPFYSEEK